MYLHTRMLHATTNSGWWNLIGDARMNFDITLDPSSISKRGASTMRTWMRKGYNDRPTGRLAAYWTMLMHGAGARYLMQYDRTTCRVVLLDKTLEPRMNEIIADFKAFGILANAAAGEPEWHRQWRQREQLDFNGGDDVRIPGHTRQHVGEYSFTAPMGHRVERCDKFVEMLGHPLPELQAALKSVTERHKFRIRINHGDYRSNRKRGTSTVTTINRVRA
jgi:hypothetical protein